MKKLMYLVMTIAMSLFAADASAQYIPVTASSCIVDGSGSTIGSGTLIVVGTDSNDNPVVYRAGTSFITTTAPVTKTITAGSVSSFQLADPASSSPLNISYRFVVQDNTTKKITVYKGINITPNDVLVSGSFTTFNICKMNPGAGVASFGGFTTPSLVSGDWTVTRDLFVNRNSFMGNIDNFFMIDGNKYAKSQAGLVSAITDASTITGSVVKVQPGTYALSSAVLIPTGVNVECASPNSTIFTLSGTDAAFVFDSVSHASLKNCQIQLSSTSTQRCIAFRNTTGNNEWNFAINNYCITPSVTTTPVAGQVGVLFETSTTFANYWNWVIFNRTLKVDTGFQLTNLGAFSSNGSNDNYLIANSSHFNTTGISIIKFAQENHIIGFSDSASGFTGSNKCFAIGDGTNAAANNTLDNITCDNGSSGQAYAIATNANQNSIDNLLDADGIGSTNAGSNNTIKRRTSSGGTAELDIPDLIIRREANFNTDKIHGGTSGSLTTPGNAWGLFGDFVSGRNDVTTALCSNNTTSDYSTFSFATSAYGSFCFEMSGKPAANEANSLINIYYRLAGSAAGKGSLIATIDHNGKITANAGLGIGTASGSSVTQIQIKQAAVGCTTSASVGATCTSSAQSFTSSFADTAYNIACTLNTPTGVPVISTVAKSAASFTITIAALTAVGATGNYDCLATHL